jgi:hypothetical protein
MSELWVDPELDVANAPNVVVRQAVEALVGKHSSDTDDVKRSILLLARAVTDLAARVPSVESHLKQRMDALEDATEGSE